MDPKGAKVSDKISDFAGNRAFWENVLLIDRRSLYLWVVEIKFHSVVRKVDSVFAVKSHRII